MSTNHWSNSFDLSENTTNLLSASVISKKHTYSSMGSSGKGDSNEPQYSKDAPINSKSLISGAPPPSNLNFSAAGDTSTTRTGRIPRPIAIVSPCGVVPPSISTSEYSNGAPSSRHFFKIKNASCQEAMFILLAHTHGSKLAETLAAKFHWKLQRPLAELITVARELDEHCSGQDEKCDRLSGLPISE